MWRLRRDPQPEGRAELHPAPAPYHGLMTEQDILAHIQDLVKQEHQLRSKATSGELDPETERAKLADLEVMLDQCWDLLRQRRARIDQGGNPDEAQANPVKQVEGYLQ